MGKSGKDKVYLWGKSSALEGRNELGSGDTDSFREEEKRKGKTNRNQLPGKGNGRRAVGEVHKQFAPNPNQSNACAKAVSCKRGWKRISEKRCHEKGGFLKESSRRDVGFFVRQGNRHFPQGYFYRCERGTNSGLLRGGGCRGAIEGSISCNHVVSQRQEKKSEAGFISRAPREGKGWKKRET